MLTKQGELAPVNIPVHKSHHNMYDCIAVYIFCIINLYTQFMPVDVILFTRPAYLYKSSHRISYIKSHLFFRMALLQ